MHYRADIDGIRAIAVLSIVSFHAFPDWIKGGFIGVDIFYVISGYLISTIIFRDIERNDFSYATFYARRIRRIFPALLIVLISTFIFGYFLLYKDDFKILTKHIAAGASFISNIVFWRESGYFDIEATRKPLLHLWSLGIEEQFYIVCPVLFVFLFKRIRNPLLIICLFLSVSFLLNISLISIRPVATFYLPITRFWEILLGSLLSYLTLYYDGLSGLVSARWSGKVSTSELHKKSSEILAWFGLLLIVAAVLLTSKDNKFPGWWALLPTIGTFLLISAGPDSWLNRNVLSQRILIWIGLISYPLYLWHWPLLSFARILEITEPALEVRIVLVLTSLLLSWITYILIERPIRFGEYKAEKTTILCLLMVIIGSVGFYTWKNPLTGYSTLVSNNASSQKYVDNREAFYWSDSKRIDPACRDRYPSVEGFCQISNPTGTPSVALVGDSHANTLFDAVSANLNKRHINSVQFGEGGCPPFLGVESDNANCQRIMKNIIDYLISDQQIRYVILAGRFAATQSGVNFGGITGNNWYHLKLENHPEITNRDEIFKVGLSNTVKELTKAGKKIIIALDYPELDFNPKRRVKGTLFIDKKIVDARQKQYRNIVADVVQHYPKVQTIDLTQYFCNYKVCYAEFKGNILYRDSHHLGINGLVYLRDKLELPIQ